MNKYIIPGILVICYVVVYDKNLADSLANDYKIDMTKTTDGDQSNDMDLKLVELPIKAKTDTDDFHYYEDIETKTGIYFAKKGHLLNKVKLKQPWYMCIFNLCTIWRDAGNGIMSNMVVVNEIDGAEPDVNVYLTNGDKLFYYIESYYHWFSKDKPVERTITLSKPEQYSSIKIYTHGGFVTRLNDFNKYNVYMNKLYNGYRSRKLNKISYSIIFKSDSKCIKITIRDKVVWKFKDKFPEAMYYYEDLNMAIIEFNVYNYSVYKCAEGRWDEVFSTDMKRETMRYGGDIKSKYTLISSEEKIDLNRTYTKLSDSDSENSAETINYNKTHKQLPEIINKDRPVIDSHKYSPDFIRLQIELDMDQKVSCEYYDYKYDSESKTDSFRCKNEYRFKVLKKGGHKIWEKVDNRNAVRIDINDITNGVGGKRKETIDGGMNKADIKLAVTVHFEGGTRKIFVKSVPNGPIDKDSRKGSYVVTKREIISACRKDNLNGRKRSVDDETIPLITERV